MNNKNLSFFDKLTNKGNFWESRIEIKTIAWWACGDGYFVRKINMELLRARVCAMHFCRFSCVRAHTRENEKNFIFLYPLEIQRFKKHKTGGKIGKNG